MTSTALSKLFSGSKHEANNKLLVSVGMRSGVLRNEWRTSEPPSSLNGTVTEPSATYENGTEFNEVLLTHQIFSNTNSRKVEVGFLQSYNCVTVTSRHQQFQ